jgi:hypothetical protein
VVETPLTGQVPDFIPPVAGATTVDLVNGILPGIDPFPLFDLATSRATSAFNPAAYRGANGRLNVYFSRNANATTALVGVGAPYKLFHTHVNWNESLGTWVSANNGVPVADPSANTASWFTTPALMGGVDTPLVTNYDVSPSVLDLAIGVDQLLWINGSVSNGQARETLKWSPLNVDGVPTNLIGADWVPNSDPNLRRSGTRGLDILGDGSTLMALFTMPSRVL